MIIAAHGQRGLSLGVNSAKYRHLWRRDFLVSVYERITMSINHQVNRYRIECDRFDSTINVLYNTARERELSGVLPFDEFRALQSLGFGKALLPTDAGGLEVDHADLLEFVARLAEADANVAHVYRGQFIFSERIRGLSAGGQRDYWIQQIVDGAFITNAHTEPPADKAVDDAEWTSINEHGLVVGEKFYGTGSLFATHFDVVVRRPDGSKGCAVVRADDPAVSVTDDWDGFGQRLTTSGSTRYAGAIVVGHGHFPLFGIYHTAWAQALNTAILAGIFRRVVDDAVDIIRSRPRAGLHSANPVTVQDPIVLTRLGGLVARLNTVNALLESIGGLFRRIENPIDPPWEEFPEFDDYPAELHDVLRLYADVLAAQDVTAQNVLAAANEILDFGGAGSVRVGQALDRHWRNARAIASQSPLLFKPHVIGSVFLNGRLPI